jgi:transaldolase
MMDMPSTRKDEAVEKNPLVTLKRFGQSIWLDYLSSDILDNNELARLISEDGVSGVTDNPAIFHKAISSSHRYDAALEALVRDGLDVDAIYTSLIVDDVTRAADLLAPVYKETHGDDGYVSLEVSPHLARDAQGTIAQARTLWKMVSRPNLFIKVPGTSEGLVAIRQLISEGININITLLFGIPRYRETALAYLAGLGDRISSGKPIDNVASVASFFLSRIDVLLDPMLELIANAGGENAKIANSLVGEIAIASAKEAYRVFQEIFLGDRFKPIAAKGGRVQKVLWASTGTKNPQYSDVKYVEPLIGPHSVNTVPVETLDAYRNHGDPAPRLAEGLENATAMLSRLTDIGIDIDKQTQRLENEGIEKFNDAYDAVVDALAKHRESISEYEEADQGPS